MSYYVYDQNNSGGFYITNDDVMSVVIVEADNFDEATETITKIVEDYSDFCYCCGERWAIYDPRVYKTVSIPGVELEGEALLYRKDGTKKIIPWEMYGMWEYLEEVDNDSEV